MSWNAANVRQRMSWGVGLLSLAALVGCSGAPVETSAEQLAAQDIQAAVPTDNVVAQESAGDRGSSIPTADFQATPRLVKNAALQLELTDVDTAISTISEILGQYQGDLLQLSDQESQAGIPRQITLQLRVPQANLDNTLDDLRALGTVKNQSITAEDVSTQLVDLQARVRNLRKSEESLLAIMERSGSIADVLEVSRELSTIREAIERNDAQLKSLQNRVAYSTISLALVSTQVSSPVASPVGEVLGQTWGTASSSMKSLSIVLLQLSLWLLAFSPYIGILVLSGWLGKRYWPSRRPVEAPANPN